MSTYFRNLARATRFMGRALAGAIGYEGASQGRRLAGWQEMDSAISALLATEGSSLRSRARGLGRKNPWAKNACDCFNANAIGTGIVPQPKHPDADTRKALKELWDRSVDEMDADGRLDFYGLQSLVAREIFEAGEVLVRFRPRYAEDGLLVPIQLQALESEHLPLTKNEMGEGRNRIRSGIEFTPYGKRVAYHLYREHPGIGAMSLTDSAGEFSRVPAADVLHCHPILRAGQLRGQPWLAAIMVILYELDLFVDAVLTRQKLSNLMVGWQRAMTDDTAGALLEAARTAGGEYAPEGVGFGELQPGTVLDLGSTGMTLEWSKPPDPASTLPEFVGVLLHAICAGSGIPYSLLNWNTSEANFSSMRGELNEFRRRIEQFQHHVMVFQFCQPVWNRWVREAVLAGRIDKPKDEQGWLDLYAVNWRTPQWAWVNPLQDAMTEMTLIRGGIKARSSSILERGEDPEEVDAQIAADNARADALGLVLDSDPRRTADNGAAQNAAVAENDADQAQEGNRNAPTPPRQ